VLKKRKLRPTPEYLKGMRIGATHRWFARFYGNYETITGKLRRFSFQVRVSPKLSQNRKALANNIRMTCGTLLDGNIPEHMQGDTFHSFIDLRLARWFRVRRLRDYEAGVVYGR
jgi:hypothetical protein